MPITFNATNPKAIAWAKAHAAELIAGITETTRQNIRDIVARGLEAGDGADDIASEIYDEVGDEDRADLIARNESMAAVNAGQRALWEQAVEDGDLTGDEEQVWITTPDDRLCPICEPMDGETAPLGESFDVDGEELDGPPAHVNCRCTTGLQLPSIAQSRAAGGPGSGNFGHAGRPGEVGGSADDTATPLTDVQTEALQNYSGYGPDLNVVLRHGGELQPFDVKNDTVGHLDRAIAAQPALPRETTLYRVVDKATADKLVFQSTFVDRGFVSTSKSLRAIEAIADELDADNNELTILRIVTDDGVHGLNVNEHLPREQNYFRYQQETVLERGLKFLVLRPHQVKGWTMLNLVVSK